MSCEERFFGALEEYQKLDVHAQSRRAERRHRIAAAILMILILSEGAIFIAALFYSPNVEVSRGIRKAEELVSKGEYEQAIAAYIETLEVKRTDKAQEGLVNACLMYADQLFAQENYQKAKFYYNFVFLYDDNNERAYMGVQACELEERNLLRKDYQELLGGNSGE